MDFFFGHHVTERSQPRIQNNRIVIMLTMGIRAGRNVISVIDFNCTYFYIFFYITDHYHLYIWECDTAIPQQGLMKNTCWLFLKIFSSLHNIFTHCKEYYNVFVLIISDVMHCMVYFQYIYLIKNLWIYKVRSNYSLGLS